MGYNEYILCDFTINNVLEDEYLWLKDIFDVDIDMNGSIEELITTGTVLDIGEHSPEVLSFLAKIKKYCTSDCDIFPMFSMENCDEEYPSDFYFNCVYDYSENITANMLAMAKVMQDFLKTFRPNEKISFRWIRYDNRGCDVYDGGAYKISAEKVDYINLKEWLSSMKQQNLLTYQLNKFIVLQ
jgi:hypothetical protein